MATDKQIAANQENAKKSTGPSTPEALAAIALNNFRHGLATKDHESFGFLANEDPKRFEDLVNLLSHEHKPESETEFILIRHMAEAEWLRARAQRFQTDCLRNGPHSKEADKLPLYIRYATTHERAFYKALKELQSLRQQKVNTQIGIESQQLKTAAAERSSEVVNIKKEAQILKREEFVFKKEVFAARQKPQTEPKTTPAEANSAEGVLKMAA